MTAKDLSKEALKGFFTLIIAVLAALVTVSMQSNHDDEKFLKEKLDKKLDKVEFIEECKSIDVKLEKKVDKDAFTQYLEAQQKTNDLLLDEIRLNRAAITGRN